MAFHLNADRRAFEKEKEEFYALHERIPKLPKLKVGSKEAFEQSWPIFLRSVAGVRESVAVDAITEFMDESFVVDFWHENQERDENFKKTLAYAKETILKAFQQQMSTVEAMTRFYQRTQYLNEDVIEFFYSLKTFLHHVGLNSEHELFRKLMRWRFLTGIHPELRFRAISSSPLPADVEELFSFVSKIEIKMSNNVGRWEKKKKFPAAKSSRCLKCGYEKCACNVDSSKPCWVCDNKGHLPKNCPQK